MINLTILQWIIFILRKTVLIEGKDQPQKRIYLQHRSLTKDLYPKGTPKLKVSIDKSASISKGRLTAMTTNPQISVLYTIEVVVYFCLGEVQNWCSWPQEALRHKVTCVPRLTDTQLSSSWGLQGQPGHQHLASRWGRKESFMGGGFFKARPRNSSCHFC